MAVSNNDRRDAGTLSVGLVAGDRRLAALAEPVRTCPLLSLIAQAGMPQAEALPEVPWLDDVRVLLGQTGLQGVILATSPRRDPELRALAAERKLPVWRLAPLTPDFNRTVEEVAASREHPAVCRTASWWEFLAAHVWNEFDWPAEFKPRSSELLLSEPGPAAHTWTADPAEFGGGVLSAAAFTWLEALVALRGLPDSVTATVGNYRPNALGPPRANEDTAFAILRYADAGSALIRATWDQPPYTTRLTHHAADLSVVLTVDDITLYDTAGNALERHPVPADWLGDEFLRFAEAVQTDARERAAAPLERQLAAAAVLETIYLAARTNQPESPRRRYAMHGLPEPRL